MDHSCVWLQEEPDGVEGTRVALATKIAWMLRILVNLAHTGSSPCPTYTLQLKEGHRAHE